MRLYNEEDIKSREINDVKQLTIKLKSADLMSLKCSKSIGIGPISLGDIYVSASLGSNIDFAYMLKKKNETQKESDDANVSGGISLTFKGGMESNEAIKNYLDVTANLNCSVGTKSIWPYNGNKSKIATYFYMGYTYLTVNGYVDSWLVGGHKNFEFNWGLFDTYLESKDRLIFDLKNGEVYFEKK